MLRSLLKDTFSLVTVQHTHVSTTQLYQQTLESYC